MNPRYASLLARLAHWQATPAAVLVHVDLRHMRSINRLSGPDCGDRLLRQVQQQLQAWAGPDGIAEHLRSNEYVGLKPIDHAQGAADEAADLRQRLVALTYPSPMGKSHAAVAIGLQLARAGADWPRLLGEVAEACQRAKQRGLNQIATPAALFDEGAAEPVHASRVAAFRELQAQGRLRLYPQPIMDIRGATPRLAKAEFLIRMQDGGSAVPLPAGTIDSLEYFGLTTELDEFSANAAFDWIDQNPACLARLDGVSINLSCRSIEDSAFMDRLLREVRALKPPPGKLRFEITESAAIAHLPLAAELIADFRASGCRFALDDFGSGLCSFGYLQSLPVDEVKIDGRFVRSMVTDPVSAEIVRAIHQVARATGKQTVAEFVDDPRQLAALRAIGVDYAQGWLFHPAVPPERLRELLRAESGCGAAPAAQA